MEAISGAKTATVSLLYAGAQKNPFRTHALEFIRRSMDEVRYSYANGKMPSVW
ncbi:MAG TPA: hypothetical protein VN512_00295 [Clostridia bacterium]|nr:hypothetical protein [Clostridia bacterium]